MVSQIPISLKIDLDNLSDIDYLCKLQHPAGVKLNRNKLINVFVRKSLDICLLHMDISGKFPNYLINIL